MTNGRCLCGAVRVAVSGALPPPNACHCSQCRRQSGHFWASTEVPRADLQVDGAEHVSWYHASGAARRGFCTRCGSFLFWEAVGSDTIAVAMGAFDSPTGTRLALHIFVDDKGDYYEIADGLPQNPQ